MYTLFEMLEYGPIVASDADWGLVVTINGSYLNLWVSRGDNSFENTEARSLGIDNGLHDLPITKAMELGQSWLNYLTKEGNL